MAEYSVSGDLIKADKLRNLDTCQGNYEALDLYTKILEKAPTSDKAYFGKGICLLFKQQNLEALKNFNFAVK